MQVDGRWVVLAGRAVVGEYPCRSTAVEAGWQLARAREVEHVVHYAQRVVPDDPRGFESVA
ncbi:hypothetical protein [Nocardioides lianchengensis]|uniref:Uncharacterized protein n=1 Tax=Nocardioides lianchengensis TaxID=1045774 RepID=A0A1G6R2N6_9ACTN|nr:hypothetical protein [Nocardioides lianchengensis]NYG10393.1 hypothetical protein [Nocardioides lianchengensis]SDC98818.1 hypothetical protein SAMN05421872_105125 [Nocardioides lianchengensis]